MVIHTPRGHILSGCHLDSNHFNGYCMQIASETRLGIEMWWHPPIKYSSSVLFVIMNNWIDYRWIKKSDCFSFQGPS